MISLVKVNLVMMKRDDPVVKCVLRDGEDHTTVTAKVKMFLSYIILEA